MNCPKNDYKIGTIGSHVYKSLRLTLDRSVWRALADALRLHDLMDKKEREQFERSLYDDPPEVTDANVRATIERLRGDAGLIFARGLARVFSDLDPRFKSHDAFKIGSRIILDRAFNECGCWNYHNHHEQSIIDVERVFAILDGVRPMGRMLIEMIDRDRRQFKAQQSVTEAGYFRLRVFKNGNAHLWFTSEALVEKVNKQLAAYYGEVIPDAATKEQSPDKFRPGSVVPAKDLQFYHTPEAVAEKLLDGLHLPAGSLVLEPSAGEGHLLRKIVEKFPGVSFFAVEIHADRFEKLRHYAKHGSAVVCDNFLSMKIHQRFDAVAMNPPFYGTRYMDHVRTAFALLRPHGTLRAVLPASARYNEMPKHLEFRRWIEKVHKGDRWDKWRQWNDLPPESFAESGTRIQTTILTIKKRVSAEA